MESRGFCVCTLLFGDEIRKNDQLKTIIVDREIEKGLAEWGTCEIGDGHKYLNRMII
jgi:hypothetical protein